MHSVQLTRVLDSVKVDIWPSHIVSVRVTSDDPAGTPQGTLICTTSAPPDNRIVVSEARDIVVQLINAQTIHSMTMSAEPS